jgi:hypothetical protein
MFDSARRAITGVGTHLPLPGMAAAGAGRLISPMVQVGGGGGQMSEVMDSFGRISVSDPRALARSGSAADVSSPAGVPMNLVSSPARYLQPQPQPQPQQPRR